MRPINQFFRQMKLKIASLLLLFKIQGEANAQVSSGNFEQEINYYRIADDTSAIPANPIVFIGSSSIKNWIGFDSTYAPYDAINRGFGGSTLQDQLYYANDILLAHDGVRQFVIYCGENDFASSNSITPEDVFDRFLELYRTLRSKYPTVPVIAISMKPSPSKMQMMQKIIDYNKLMQDYSLVDTSLIYADVYTPMLQANGTPNRTYFFSDMLHMNRSGYAVWNAVIEPLLLKPEIKAEETAERK